MHLYCILQRWTDICAHKPWLQHHFPLWKPCHASVCWLYCAIRHGNRVSIHSVLYTTLYFHLTSQWLPTWDTCFTKKVLAPYNTDNGFFYSVLRKMNHYQARAFDTANVSVEKLRILCRWWHEVRSSQCGVRRDRVAELYLKSTAYRVRTIIP